jgi:hypothetical protein
MKIYKYIATVRAKEPKDRMPTHYLSAKENQGDKDGELVASLWAKSGEKNGVKYNFLSGEMKSQWTDHTDPSKSRKGFVIVEEKELNRLLKLEKEVNGDTNSEEVVDDDGIPF